MVSGQRVPRTRGKLVAAGLIVETKAPPTGRGRPRLVYMVDPGADGRWGTIGPYERLSHLLVAIIRSGHSPLRVGREAVDHPQAEGRPEEIVAEVVAAMARQGFDPEVRRTRLGAEIVLHECPFESAARHDRATVCALHLGMAQGLTEGTAVTVEELVANDPKRADCRLRLRVVADDAEPGATSGQLSLRGRPSSAA